MSDGSSNQIVIDDIDSPSIKFTDLNMDDSDNKINKKRKNKKSDKPWVEKYRPKKLNDVAGQEEVTKILKQTVKDGNLPHLLLYGPAGTGKTSTILASALELFGPRKLRERVIELNASDERGINIVRNKIISFAKMAIGTSDPKYPSPNYKIIILDEADAMTKEAQSALRKTMETYSAITRFCFICNYINQIIEPINSRCVKFRFKPLDESMMIDKLTLVSKSEKMDLYPDVIEKISEISQGDLRRGIMLLQNLKYVKKDVITCNDVTIIAGCVPQKVIDQIYRISFNNKEDSQEIMNLAKKIISYGYTTINLLNNINLLVVNDDKLTDTMKAKICIHLMKTESRLISGADEYLQLLSIFMCIKSVYCNIDSIHKN